MSQSNANTPRYKNIGLIYRPDSVYAAEVSGKLISKLVNLGSNVVFCYPAIDFGIPGETLNDALASKLSQCDLLLVLGGDGTVLTAARVSVIDKIPLIGINLGKMGFLTECDIDQIDVTLARILMGEYQPELRLMLDVQLLRNHRSIFSAQVLNDTTVSKGAYPRLISMDVGIDGRNIISLDADGLIISTPTGSTGYSLSAGGPIVDPTIDAMIVTPVCAPGLTRRPTVIPGDSVIEVELSQEREGSYFACDGHKGLSLQQGDRIKVTRSACAAQILRAPEHCYYETLREKLGWGRL